MKNFLAKKKEAYRKGDGHQSQSEETVPKKAEDSCAFTDLDSEDETTHDTTLDLYAEYREQEEEDKWEKFCSLKNMGN